MALLHTAQPEEATGKVEEVYDRLMETARTN